jgi:hypothetical protein
MPLKDRQRKYSPKHPVFPDLAGSVFGDLTVVSYAGVDKFSRRKWNCVCKCGNKTTSLGHSLRSGNSKSCGCSRVIHLQAFRGKKRPELCLGLGVASRNSIISTYKFGAKRRGREWDLSTEEVEALFKGNCHYCGRPPMQARRHPAENGGYVYNGIDRVDNTKGYVVGNVVSCCSKCNRAKTDMTFDEFIEWIERVHSCVSRMVEERRAS